MDYVVSTPTAEKDAVRLQIIMSVLCPSHGCGQWVWEFFLLLFDSAESLFSHFILTGEAAAVP